MVKGSDALDLLNQASKDLAAIKKALDICTKQEKLSEINLKLENSENWQNIEITKKLSQEKAIIEKTLEDFHLISSDLHAIKELIQTFNTNDLSEVYIELDNIVKKVSKMKIITMFSEEADSNDTFLQINSGAGGVESQDWVEMILRMYIMWAERRNFAIEIIDKIEGNEAGVKNVTLKICGNYAHGWLKRETGVHRLVRISPFNSNQKRQTSFASVFVYPVIDDKINISINEADIEMKTHRSSGAGGQHVNKTESGVTLIHVPSGLTARSQEQRSQLQNKNQAMKMLESKLYAVELTKKLAQKDAANSAKSQVSFGSQIRNYFMYPNQLVKDLRSNFETGNITDILDGNLDEMMESLIVKGF